MRSRASGATRTGSRSRPQQFALSALDGAACELRVSRETLAVALATAESRQEFAAEYGDRRRRARGRGARRGRARRSTTPSTPARSIRWSPTGCALVAARLPVDEAIALIEDASELFEGAGGLLDGVGGLLDQAGDLVP